MRRTALLLVILGLYPLAASANERTTGAFRAHVHVVNGNLGVWFGAPNLTDSPGKEYVEIFRHADIKKGTFGLKEGWIEAGGGVFLEDGIMTPALDVRGYGRRKSMSSFLLLQALDPTEKEGSSRPTSKWTTTSPATRYSPESARTTRSGGARTP